MASIVAAVILATNRLVAIIRPAADVEQDEDEQAEVGSRLTVTGFSSP
jgi:hypothetical protein